MNRVRFHFGSSKPRLCWVAHRRQALYLCACHSWRIAWKIAVLQTCFGRNFWHLLCKHYIRCKLNVVNMLMSTCSKERENFVKDSFIFIWLSWNAEPARSITCMNAIAGTWVAAKPRIVQVFSYRCASSCPYTAACTRKCNLYTTPERIALGIP